MIRYRERNKKIYRVAHWPIWIWVFFLAPGPLTFTLFEHGPSTGNVIWLLCVMVGTGIAGLYGQLPGVEPRPYILRFTEDKPNPLYRRICYTFAWADVITFASLNLAGLAIAAVTGVWYLKQIYNYAYFPLYLTILALGTAGMLPRVRSSTKGEGTERRYFYGSVWAVTLAQALLMLLWKILPKTHVGDLIKLGAYVAGLGLLAYLAWTGTLPRTRPIVPGELMVAD
ncbi:MAG TPA: hypothetical protein VHY84_25380 [Bryobacteraceae bacterium]|jgi:hypothetical protein|nr:hypothetical protein [Bryobacteraceae bacterium]